MDTETARAFKAQGKALETIGTGVEEIKETVNGQAMAIRDVAHKRELCRAQMDGQVGEAKKAAETAKARAEVANDRVTGLKRAAWGLVVAILLEMLGFTFWIVKTTMAVGGAG